MKRKTFFIILAVLCLSGAIVLALLGIKLTSRPAVIEGLTSLGQITLEAYDAQPDETGEDGQYTIFYRYIDPKYGEIVYANSVGEDDYYSYKFDEARAEAVQSEVPDETDEAGETARRTEIRRYVYVYPKDGRYEAVFFDRYQGLTDVSELIDPTPKVSSTYYYIVAGVLLIAGAYLIFLGLTGKRREK